MRLGPTSDRRPRRFELTSEEWERVKRARRQPMTAREALSLMARSPRLIPEIARDLLSHAKQGMWQSSAVVWTLDTERVRREVPDAARGIAFSPVEPFLDVLLPRLKRTDRVLDVGGGDGRISRLVAPHVHELLCSDVSRTMVAEATQNLAEFDNATTFLAHGYTLKPLPDASFDVVFAQGVLPFIEVNQGLALLDEMYRVVRPGGTAVVTAFTIDDPAWSREQVDAVRHSAERGRFTAGLFRSYCEAQVDTMVRAVGFVIDETTLGEDPTHERRPPYIVVASRPQPSAEEEKRTTGFEPATLSLGS
jgi:SAM-dependent methyltransferase